MQKWHVLNCVLFANMANARNLRVLVAGDLDNNNRMFYDLIAEKLSQVEGYDVFLLSQDLGPCQLKEVSPKLTKVGVWKNY